MHKPSMVFKSRLHARLIFELLFFLLVGGPPFVCWAQFQQHSSPCENVVSEAQKLYEEGRFSLAISQLRRCLPEGVPAAQRVGAYRLLALVYLAEEQREEARSAIKEIFAQKRDYVCDPAQDSPPYCDLVSEVQVSIPASTWEKLTGGWKKWLWYGGGIIGAGTAMYLASQNPNNGNNIGAEGKPLDAPPPLPTKP